MCDKKSIFQSVSFSIPLVYFSRLNGLFYYRSDAVKINNLWSPFYAFAIKREQIFIAARWQVTDATKELRCDRSNMWGEEIRSSVNSLSRLLLIQAVYETVPRLVIYFERSAHSRFECLITRTTYKVNSKVKSEFRQRKFFADWKLIVWPNEC